MTPRAQQAYEKYQKTRPANQNAVFVLNAIGAAGGYEWDEDLNVAKMGAVKMCVASAASKRQTEDCSIYDINGEVVWDVNAVVDKEAPAKEGNTEERLTKLKSLYDKGLITKEDYDTKQAEILEGL